MGINDFEGARPGQSLHRAASKDAGKGRDAKMSRTSWYSPWILRATLHLTVTVSGDILFWQIPKRIRALKLIQLSTTSQPKTKEKINKI